MRCFFLLLSAANFFFLVPEVLAALGVPLLAVLQVLRVRGEDGAECEVIGARLGARRRLLGDAVVLLGVLHGLLHELLHEVAAVALLADARRALPARVRPRRLGEDGEEQHDAHNDEELVGHCEMIFFWYRRLLCGCFEFLFLVRKK